MVCEAVKLTGFSFTNFFVVVVLSPPFLTWSKYMNCFDFLIIFISNLSFTGKSHVALVGVLPLVGVGQEWGSCWAVPVSKHPAPKQNLSFKPMWLPWHKCLKIVAQERCLAGSSDLVLMEKTGQSYFDVSALLPPLLTHWEEQTCKQTCSIVAGLLHFSTAWEWFGSLSLAVRGNQASQVPHAGAGGLCHNQ